MFRIRCLIGLLLLAAPLALAQPPAGDSPATQALLAEIRQLRSDLETTAATIQRVQIVLFRLQTQASVVERAEQRAQQAHDNCEAIESQSKQAAGQLAGVEARMRSQIEPLERQNLEMVAASLKGSLENLQPQAQQCPADQMAAEAELRTEKAKKNDLEELLDKLDRVLAGYGAK